MCSHKGTGAGQITEGLPVQLQSLLLSAELCWELEMWNVATDKGCKNANVRQASRAQWP